MGRIIFNPKAFAPQYVAPAREPQGKRSKLDPFLTPSGIIATAGLLKMMGGLRLPEGLRDPGVDANAEAIKQAAKARAAQKENFENQRQAYDAEMRKYMQPDQDVLARTASITPEDKKAISEDTLRRARIDANRAFQQGDTAKAREILTQAGDRVGLVSLQMTSGERARRNIEKSRQDSDRLSRMVMPGELPLSQRKGDTPQAAAERKANEGLNWLPKSFKELSEEAMAPGATGVSGDQAAAAMQEAIRLAKEERPVQGVAGLPSLGPPVGTSLDKESEQQFEYGGINLKELMTDEKGEPSQKMKGMTRAQIRDLLVQWKEEGKAAALRAAASTGRDAAEVNAYEEQLHRHLRMKARQERPEHLIPKPVLEIDESELLDLAGEDAYHAHIRRSRAKDPYYGMSPEDAVIEIYKDASKADTEEEQARLKAAILTYEPKARTFGDLFVDSRQSRIMEHLSNMGKIFPGIGKPVSDLDKARTAKIQAETKKLEASLRGLGSAAKKNRLDKGLKAARKDLEKVIAARHNIPALKAKVLQAGKWTEDSFKFGAPLLSTTGKQLTPEQKKDVDAYNKANAAYSRELGAGLDDLRVSRTALATGDTVRAERVLKRLLDNYTVRKAVRSVENRLAKTQEKIEQAYRDDFRRRQEAKAK